MIARYRARLLALMIGDGNSPLDSSNRQEFKMIWETPCAIDFRFGMEITMYIARR